MFDASTPGTHRADPPAPDVPAEDMNGPAHAHLPAGYNDPPGGVTDTPPRHQDFYTDPPIPDADDVPLLSTLDQLRAVAAEEDTREPITVLNPRETIRLTLRTDLDQPDIQRWSNKALDRKDREKLNRRGGAPNMTRLNPVVMFASAIAETTLQVEVWQRATRTWEVVRNERNGEPLTFADTALRQVLGGMDVVSAVKRAFNGSEPALMAAGQRLIDASGFGDDDVVDGDDEDPTVAVG